MSGKLVNLETDAIGKFLQTVASGLGLTARGIKKDANAEAYRILKVSDAENEAALKRLETMDRVERYAYYREQRKLNNIRNIVEKAERQFKPDEQVSPDPVDADWTARFFSMAEDISDEQMQDLWAKILSGEVKKPKSYSLRTLETLRNMSKEEAQLAVKYSKYLIARHSIYVNEEIFEEQSAVDLLILEELGLINADSSLTLSIIKDEFPDEPLALRTENKILISHLKAENKIYPKLPARRLTKTGAEIMRLIDTSTRKDLLDIIGEELAREYNYKLTLHKLTKIEDGYLSYDDEPLETFGPE